SRRPLAGASDGLRKARSGQTDGRGEPALCGRRPNCSLERRGGNHSTGGRRLMRTAIVDRPLDACALLAEVAHHRNGATVVFVGSVRDVNDGADVSGLDYSAYTAMAAPELDGIAGE